MYALTERQYEELKRYEDDKPLCQFLPPLPSLVGGGYIRKSIGAATYRESGGFYEITDAGHEALAGFRERYGVPA